MESSKKIKQGQLDLSSKENVANKATNLTSPDNTKYPTTQAVVNEFLKVSKKYISAVANSITGVTSETVIQTILIPANTFDSVDIFQLVAPLQKSTSASNITFTVYHGLSANATTTAIGLVTLTTGNRINTFSRFINLLGSNNANVNVPSVASQPSPYQGQNVVSANFTFNPTVNNWFTITANPSVVSESAGIYGMFITPKKY